MKKTEKGMPGYLNYKRKIEIIRTLAYFGIVIAILLLGYFQTGTKLNLLTVVAIVGCLPASKALVGVITRFPYRSIDGERAKEIASKTDLLTVISIMRTGSRFTRSSSSPEAMNMIMRFMRSQEKSSKQNGTSTTITDRIPPGPDRKSAPVASGYCEGR